MIAFLQGEIRMRPYLGVQSEAQKNIELVYSNTTSDMKSGLLAGIGFDAYVQPDISLQAGLDYEGARYTTLPENNYRYTYINLGGHYELNEYMQIGADFGQQRFAAETVSSSYQALGLTPKLVLNYLPDGSFSVQQENMRTRYDDVLAKDTYLHTTTYQLDQGVTNWCAFMVGRYFVVNQMNVATQSYTADGYKASLTLYPLDMFATGFSADWLTTKYSERLIGELEMTRTLGWFGEYTYEDWSIQLQYSYTDNQGEYAQQAYDNNTVLIAFRWQPAFGSPYVQGAKTRAEHYAVLAQEELAENPGFAEKQLRKALFLDPDNTDYQFYLAYAFHRQERFAQSVYLFEKLLAQDPLDSEIYPLLMYDYIQLGQKENARLLLVRVAELARVSEEFKEIHTLIKEAAVE